jgi:25S rRNA (uracil2843-N3)-methyltransferase
MAPKSKKHSKGKAADRPMATLNIQSSHIGVQSAGSREIPLEVQQRILNIFTDALPLSPDINLSQIVQEVKGHLYNRDFATAFGTERFLLAYALRWSAGRALAYADIFAGIDVKQRWLPGQDSDVQTLKQNLSRAEVLCVGGGAGAEVVALAAIAGTFSWSQLSVTAVDVAEWLPVLGKLTAAVTEPPVLSSYASAANRDANQALLDSVRLRVDFRRHDILECSEEELRLLVAEVSLVTVMFTLNELYSTSVAKTTAFLLKLTELMKPSGWLIVVDSSGSYSEVTLGKDTVPRRYPMKWLLDHTLQQIAGNEPNGFGKWEKHVAEESRWFRLSDKLRYPLELENMRYQIYVYRRQDSNDNSQGDREKNHESLQE